MSSISNFFREKGIDTRAFEQGEVYIARDIEVKIPDEKLTGRTNHDKRPVVILYNHSTNSNPLYPIVVAAPLSHKITRKRESDLEVFAEKDGLEQDSLLRLGLAQPFLKIDLEGPVAKISDERIEQMLALLLHLLGVDMEDTDAAVDILF